MAEANNKKVMLQEQLRELRDAWERFQAELGALKQEQKAVLDQIGKRVQAKQYGKL
jgi:hypothetical protein